jgi:hypothetical protein
MGPGLKLLFVWGNFTQRWLLIPFVRKPFAIPASRKIIIITVLQSNKNNSAISVLSLESDRDKMNFWRFEAND